MMPTTEGLPESANQICTCCRSDGWGCECLYHYEADCPFTIENYDDD